MFSPLCDRRNETQTEQDTKKNITSLHWVHTILFLSPIGELLFSSIIGMQTMVEIESSVKKTWKNLSGSVFGFHFFAQFSTNNPTLV
jgi:dipeptide/tripeptide permease